MTRLRVQPSWHRQIIITLLVLLQTVHAITPTAVIDLYSNQEKIHSIYTSTAAFGVTLPFGKPNVPSAPIVLAPENNPYLCQPVQENLSSTDPKIILVKRGQCSFKQKAQNAQQLRAIHVIVYDTLATKYDSVENEIVYPTATIDYECNNGNAFIPALELYMDATAYDDQNNELLSGSDDNLCALYHDAENDDLFEKTCSSQRCVLTGNTDSTQNLVQACCAWDIYMVLGDDASITEDIDISSSFLTMEKGKELLDLLESQENITATVYLRYYPKVNASSVLICILGTFVTWLAAWINAKSYRDLSKKLENPSSNVQNETRQVTRPIAETQAQHSPQNENQDETLVLKPIHAVVFVIVSSATLLILFFTKLYAVVTVFYVIGGSVSMGTILINPLLSRIFKRSATLTKSIMQKDGWFSITLINIISFAIAVALGSIWLWIRFSKVNPETQTFYWTVQDLMGACMCIEFLKVVRLNNIKVATILLIAAFIYDIFFVFITPYLFGGESVMMTVATGGVTSEQDPYHCEKYPSDKGCNTVPLPMLFAIPRIGDYMGGLSMLGLGDIILPGLICCFCARLDTAKRLVVAFSRTDRNESSEKRKGRLFDGYLYKVIIAYAMGLILANLGVYLMKKGQPALMYIVPLTLAIVAINARVNEELKALWTGPEQLKEADTILEGLQRKPVRNESQPQQNDLEENIELRNVL
ncbi:signal peptide peptidase-like 2B [Chaetoceros tenuissimus]|uniref:Signal peptide peptidase-like 2B n=1 Tax=Chaetoceros tenuissimus TaxID=426638 RepID=A0AAD3H7V1_9STRA|nr:signal peptide peptidase-like 2B [Chaetoceros tenuissimus]